MMKLRAKVAAHLFFGVPIAREDRPRAIGDIFCWGDTGEAGPVNGFRADGGIDLDWTAGCATARTENDPPVRR